jgi:hypothetical protein
MDDASEKRRMELFRERAMNVLRRKGISEGQYVTVGADSQPYKTA